MTLYEFIRLNLSKRADVIGTTGIFLETHLDKGNSINLYYLNGFFVEVLKSSTDKVIEITPFTKGYRVEQYSDKINPHKGFVIP